MCSLLSVGRELTVRRRLPHLKATGDTSSLRNTTTSRNALDVELALSNP